jgi:hypothetical protein
MFILQSVKTMRIESFRPSVKHHSTVEKYMANRNQLDGVQRWMDR